MRRKLLSAVLITEYVSLRLSVVKASNSSVLYLFYRFKEHFFVISFTLHTVLYAWFLSSDVTIQHFYVFQVVFFFNPWMWERHQKPVTCKEWINKKNDRFVTPSPIQIKNINKKKPIDVPVKYTLPVEHMKWSSSWKRLQSTNFSSQSSECNFKDLNMYRQSL